MCMHVCIACSCDVCTCVSYVNHCLFLMFFRINWFRSKNFLIVCIKISTYLVTIPHLNMHKSNLKFQLV